MEILKDGQIISEEDITQKSFYLIGRNRDYCDIVLDHPSISRRHAILQHKDTGELFLYDLGSTHGSFLNKKLITQQEYVQLGIGDFMNFGSSTRKFIIGGPEEYVVNPEGVIIYIYIYILCI